MCDVCRCKNGDFISFKDLPSELRSEGSILKKGMWIGVDATMLAYSMLRTNCIWRQQTQLPPVPQKGVWDYMHTWYQTHKFANNNQVLVFVFDARRNKFKVRIL